MDILLVVTRRRDAGFGKGGVDAMLKGLCSRAQEDLGLAGDGAVLEGSSRGIHRNVRYAYPRRYEGSTVKPGVLLELGIRGCPEPMETRELRSFMAAHAVDALKDAAGAFDEYAAVPIAVLHPHRTLFEKLAVLHHLSVDLPGTETELRRAARHLYDIHQRLASDMVRNSLRASAGMAGSMAADMDRVSLEWGWPHSPRPAGGYARSPAFDPGHPSQVILEAGLEEVRDLILDRVPTLKECRLSVERAAPPL